MTKERFSEILKEYNFTDRQVEIIWDAKPSDETIDLDEQKVRETAKKIAPIKDRLVQA